MLKYKELTDDTLTLVSGMYGLYLESQQGQPVKLLQGWVNESESLEQFVASWREEMFEKVGGN